MTRWLLLVAALLAAAPGVQALECPIPQGMSPRLAAIDAEARIQFIRERLEAESTYLTRWKWTWVAVYGAITAGQGIAVRTDSIANRPKWIAGGIVSFIGFASTLVFPKHALDDGPTLAAMPDGATPGATCYTLKKAEEFLLRDAEDEEKEHGAFQHLANAGVNLIAGLVLGIAYHQWGNAAIQLVAGTAIGEVQIFTQPMGSADALAIYRTGELTPPVPASFKHPQATNPGPGYQLAIAF